VLRFFLLLGLIGCGGWESSEEDGLRVLRKTQKSDQSGFVTVSVDVEEGETHLLLTAQPESGHEAYVDTLYGPERSLLMYAGDHWESSRARTNAIFASAAPVFGFPSLPTDEALSPGSYELRVGIVDSSAKYAKGVKLDLSVALKADTALTEGELLVNLVYAGGVDEDTVFMGGMETVLSKWRELYAQAGITVVIEESTWPDGALEPPSMGSEEEYIAISAASSLRTIDVVIVPEIALWDNLYGLTGHIPGSLESSPSAAVIASASLALGTNGTYDPGEKRLFAETLAHESGHYLGLFHPVEINWEEWDSLDDTENCSTESSCLEAMQDNLMFAFPYCDASGCVPQTLLTEEQEMVMNMYVGVD
jgi:hypothetical protein